MGVRIRMETKYENYLKDSGAINVLEFNPSLIETLDGLIEYYKALLPESEKVCDIFIDFHLDKKSDKIIFETLFFFSQNYLGVVPDFLKPTGVVIDRYPINKKIQFLEVSIHHYGYDKIMMILPNKKEITFKAESSNCKCLKNIYNLYLKDNLTV